MCGVDRTAIFTVELAISRGSPAGLDDRAPRVSLTVEGGGTSEGASTAADAIQMPGGRGRAFRLLLLGTKTAEEEGVGWCEDAHGTRVGERDVSRRISPGSGFTSSLRFAGDLHDRP